MRFIRVLVALLVATLLGAGLTTVVSGPAQAAKKLDRVLEEEDPRDNTLTYNAKLLKGIVTLPQVDGTVLPYANGKVLIQKKKCGKCKWKVVQKIKTKANGKYKTRIFVPKTGVWKWRVYIKGNATYAATKGNAWNLYFDSRG